MPISQIFDKDIDILIQNVARFFVSEGNAKLVSILAYAQISAEQTGFDNFDGGTDIYTVYLEIPQILYLEIASELENISQLIQEKLSIFLHRYPNTWISSIKISPQLKESSSWQMDARNWIAGKDINNQGRVRSNNIASRECDGLLFRSTPEINIYKALKSKGITFAPLPVFLKGGKEYSRIEPDFIILKDGAIFCIEIDGDTVHIESPSEANARTRILSNEGTIIERFSASRCDTPQKADVLATEILELINKHKTNRF